MKGYLRRWQEKNLRTIIGQTDKGQLEAGPVAAIKFTGIVFVAQSLPHVEAVVRFVKKLESLDQRCVYLAFVPRQISRKVDYGYMHFSQRDFNLLGIPRNRHIVTFSRRHFSSIINLDTTDELGLHYLCSKIPAKFKIGLGSEFQENYDVCLTPNVDDSLEATLEKTLDIFTKTCLQ